MSYYDGDPFSNHQLNEVKCAECEEYFDDQEKEGNICPPCVQKGYGELLKCTNCAYEIDQANERGFCDNCERAYQLGKEGESK